MTNKIPDDVIEAMAKAAVDVSAEVSHMGVWADISADTKSILLAEQRDDERHKTPVIGEAYSHDALLGSTGDAVDKS